MIIRAIVRKMGKSGGLSKLQLVGMREEQNIYDLKQGLIKPGGRLWVYDIDRDGRSIDVTEQLSDRLC